jgi:hypothetical protein
MSPIFRSAQSSESVFDMRNWLFAVLVSLLVSCSTNVPPPVTSQMARQHSGGTIAIVQLEKGRLLFASRCIECHTLPTIKGYTDSQWPQLVDAMAPRASLDPAEREALLAYILAARAQEN